MASNESDNTFSEDLSSVSVPKKQHPSWYQPDAPELTREELSAATSQLISYPQVVRDARDPCINGQEFVNLSFMLFAEPRQLPHNKKAYGYVKVRGSKGTQDECLKDAKRIIKQVDSKNAIRIAPVGSWVPITDSDLFCQDMEDVRMNKEEVQLRDEAVKERDNHMRQVQREIREKEEELKAGKDIYDDPESLRYYSMRRVTDLKVEQEIKRMQKQIQGLQDTLVQVRTELKKLDKKYPEYNDQWIGCYNEERRKTSIPDYVPSETSLQDYEQWQLPQE